MNITPKPITASDKVDQSRDISGFNKWAQSSRTIGFLLFILGWFTIPVEVLLRKDFGQRWFTVVNFYAGLFLLLIVALVQYVVGAVWAWVQDLITHFLSALNPLSTTTEQEAMPIVDSVMNRSIVYILVAYVLMGSYHLFKIWWRNRANIALHSYSDGTSRTECVAGWLIWLLNVLTVPFVWLYMLLLPRKQRQAIPFPKLINDRTAFTNTIFEPLLLFMLAHWSHGIFSMWLFISAVALLIHANWKQTAKLNKILDFRDSVIDAKVMMQLKEGTTQANAPVQQMMQQAAEAIRENPRVMPQMTEQYPDLMSIIEEMNSDKSHLAN